MASHADEPKGAVDLVLLSGDVWVMMAGMMLPGAAPMILTFATINRRRQRPCPALCAERPCLRRLSRGLGGFSVAATLAQWGLERIGPALGRWT